VKKGCNYGRIVIILFWRQQKMRGKAEQKAAKIGCKIPHARRKRVACGCSPQAFMLFMKYMHEEIN